MTAIKSFEKPLTPEEEVYYLNLLKNENNKEAKEVLVQRNMRLVAHISKKYNNSGEELDNLISIGTIGLIKAIDTFNVDKGIRLATYASKCIENEILMNIRSNKKNKMQVSLQDPIGVDKEGNAISLIDILGTDEDYVVDKVELKMKISKLYEKIEKVLTEREKEIIKLRYGLTPSGYKTQREIAQQLDISRSYVSRIEKKALKKLKRELNIDKNNIKMIDFANSGCGPCTLDLLWYIITSVEADIDKTILIDFYRKRLEEYKGYKFTQNTWNTLLQVGLLCACRMFLAALIINTDFNNKEQMLNMDWWIENLKFILINKT